MKQKNVYDEKYIEADIVVARAFKPLQIILELVDKNFVHFNKLILFLGKSGKENVKKCQETWKIDYEVSKLDSETLANNIATIYGKTVDYTRLINKVYKLVLMIKLPIQF